MSRLGLCTYCLKKLEVGSIFKVFYRSWSYKQYSVPVCSQECKTRYETERLCQKCCYPNKILKIYEDKLYCHDITKKDFCNDIGMTCFEQMMGCRKCGSGQEFIETELPGYSRAYYCLTCVKEACILCNEDLDVNIDPDSIYTCQDCQKFLRFNQNRLNRLLNLDQKIIQTLI